MCLYMVIVWYLLGVVLSEEGQGGRVGADVVGADVVGAFVVGASVVVSAGEEGAMLAVR